MLTLGQYRAAVRLRKNGELELLAENFCREKRGESITARTDPRSELDLISLAGGSYGVSKTGVSNGVIRGLK